MNHGDGVVTTASRGLSKVGNKELSLPCSGTLTAVGTGSLPWQTFSHLRTGPPAYCSPLRGVPVTATDFLIYYRYTAVREFLY